MPEFSTQTDSGRLETMLNKQITTQQQELSVLRVRLTDAFTELKELRTERQWMITEIQRLLKESEEASVKVDKVIW